jgi:drug/metabolite transporter (DMT)-like permease
MPDTLLRQKALQLLLLCTAFWALSFPVMKTLTLTQQQILPEAGSWFLTSLCVMVRFLIAGMLLLVVFWRKIATVSRREIEQGLWLAFFSSSGVCLQMDGLGYVSTTTSAFLTQLYCVLIPLWLAMTGRRFPTMNIILCSALVLAGMALLVNLNLLAIRLGRGELETLAGSVMFAAQILCLEKPRYAANRWECFTTVMFLGMGLFAAPLLLASAPDIRVCFRAYHSLPACELLAVLVLVCSLAPFLLMNRWQREVTATEAGLVYCAEPVLVSLLALFLPASLSRWTGVAFANEPITGRLLLGGGLITAANVLLQSRWLAAKPENGKPTRAE